MNASRPLSTSLAAVVTAITLMLAAPQETRAHTSQGAQGSSHWNGGHDQCRRHGRHRYKQRAERPVADAGADQAALSGQMITLDGSRSRDPDGDKLRYDWELVKAPKGSRARLRGDHDVTPVFRVDMKGRYVVALVVRSCDGASRPDFVEVISSGNLAPAANAGADQTVFIGDVVQLDGSASSDANGDRLKFWWRMLTKPDGSRARIAHKTAVRPTFSPDLRGDYVVQLVVDDGRLVSPPDTVTIRTAPDNSGPTADAGPDQSTRIGETVTLDAAGSSDPNGDALTYEWTLVTQPDGSTTALQNDTNVESTFYVDVEGQYVAEVRVCDAAGACSEPDSVIVTAAGNSAPVAVPGADQTVDAGAQVMLDGSASTDADGDPLSYAWSLTAIPEGSAAVLENAGGSTPSFVADVPGDYVVQLVVDDGRASSAPATLVATARNTPPVAGDDVASTLEDTAITIPVLDNDADANSDVLAIDSVSQPEEGGEVAIAGGTLVFTPAPEYNGDVSFGYTVADGRGGTAVATVTVSIIAVNEAPTAEDDTASTFLGEPVTIPVLANDVDPDGDPLSIESVTQPATGGTVTVNGTDLVFTPAAGFAGTTTFSYTATDGSLTSTASVSVTVLLPTLSISDSSIVEGQSGTRTLTFTVSLSRPATRAISVRFATQNGSAAAGSDFSATASTLIFAIGAETRTVNVTVFGDTAVEADEILFVNLSVPLGATLEDAQAAGTILNDD
jgi:hypothetical protein